jgi:antitoxin (DNA-binding transcriptional repressor) of toxin-antitoxin stability system
MRLPSAEEIEICKRKQVIASLVPVQAKPGAYPDFGACRKRIFGNKIISRTGAELLVAD